MSRLVPDRVLAGLTIRQEAAGEIYEGKVAVAAVIVGRMKAKYHSDGTVAGTVLRRAQFSGWWDGSLIGDLTADDTERTTQDCLLAWDEAVAGADPTKGALLYLNEPLVRSWYGKLPAWADPKKRTVVIDQHSFYRR